MTRKYEPRVPEGVDVTRPSIARIYDYLLFGKDNFAADRAAAEKLTESRLDPRRLALANRGFLRRAVRFLAQQGVSQFLDLGSGLPTSPSVHEVARDVLPAAREATTTYAGARMPFTLRSRAQIMDLLDGFDLVEPGLVPLPEWRPDFNTDRTPLKGPTLGVVARLAA
jgi:S-adenosyl methyltransferase